MYGFNYLLAQACQVDIIYNHRQIQILWFNLRNYWPATLATESPRPMKAWQQHITVVCRDSIDNSWIFGIWLKNTCITPKMMMKRLIGVWQPKEWPCLWKQYDLLIALRKKTKYLNLHIQLGWCLKEKRITSIICSKKILGVLTPYCWPMWWCNQ